jgi:hypoxanthine phosphoribosyltransferase
MQKTFVAADDLLRDSFQLAAQISAAGFRPDFLVGLWRGGSAVGIAVQEGLDYLGIRTDHIAIRTSYRGAASYSEMVSKAETIRVHGLEYLLQNLASHHSLLIVDDVYSTGSSVNAVIEQLALKTRRNMPRNIHVASVWYRPTARTLRKPDYYVHETQDWLALPYELTGMSLDELRTHRPELLAVIDRLEPLLAVATSRQE